MNTEMNDLIFKLLAAVGGIGVVIFGLTKLFGNVLQDYLKERSRTKAEIAISSNQQRLAHDLILPDRYANSQFDIYSELWKSLQALSQKGDDLWEGANEGNIIAFAGQLRQTQASVNDGAIFFADEEYKELRKLLTAFSRFEVGKRKLIEIRDGSVLDGLENSVNEQIQHNRRDKQEYETVLEKIRISFRNRLSKFD